MNKLLLRDIERIPYDCASLYLKKYTSKIYEVTGTVRYASPDSEPDVFEVVIRVEDNYPFVIPTLLETGGRYPFRGARHFNEDGTCCVEVPAVLKKAARKGLRLREYIERFVVPFFANQIYFDSKGEFLSERSHGVEGIREHVASIVGTYEKAEIQHLIKLLSIGQKVGRNSGCVCGSGVKYKYCHQKMLTELNRLYTWQDLQRIFG